MGVVSAAEGCGGYGIRMMTLFFPFFLLGDREREGDRREDRGRL